MRKTLTVIQTLTLGYFLLTLIGGVLLSLPISSESKSYTSFIDSLFLSASAISTTGLAVRDVGSYYSLFGRLVVLILVQIGGLGYMIFIALVSMGVGMNMNLDGHKLLNESLSRPNHIAIKKFVKSVILFTFFFELIGAIALFFVYNQDYSFFQSVYSAIFHSISAFCTAGFSLNSTSFIHYQDSLLANSIIAVVTVAGGIGFFVLLDLSYFFKWIIKRKKPNKLSDHSKLVLVVTSGLLAAGTLLLFFTEAKNENSLSILQRLLHSSFQAISASTTTGFNSVDIGVMKPLSLLIIVILMFVGASPGSTGGGIKTTTFGIILLFVRKVIRNQDTVYSFNRTINIETVYKAFGITIIYTLYMLGVIILLAVSTSFSLMQLLFETASALGTVGLSMGITPALDSFSKLLITLTMIVGRVGPLAIGYSLVGKVKSKKCSYPIGDVMAG